LRSGKLFSILILLVFGFRTPPFSDRNFFRFPISPGKTSYLAGTMGELRRGHFHGGIDVKTLGQTGLPIYAAADGFISRVSITPAGYGRRLNIRHENGFTTVYAHLKEFAPEIEKRAFQLQYQNESFRLDYFPRRLEFPVKKGEIIAFSGNSGFSAAPHLHFEIRDAENRQLNPLDFNFLEVVDSSAPIIQRIRVIPKSSRTRINGHLAPKEYRCYFDSNSGLYKIRDTIFVSGPFALEFKGYDKMSGNWNRTGIQGYSLEMNGKRVFEARINNLPVLLTRFINLHIDFETLVRKNTWFHRIYKETGNLLPFYSSNGKDGIIELKDPMAQGLDFSLYDASGNVSHASFQARKRKFNAMAIEIDSDTSKSQILKCSKLNNVLKIKVLGHLGNEPLYLYSGNLKFEVLHSYIENNSLVYLWDLKKILPDSLKIGESKKIFSYKAMVPNGREFSFFSKDIQIDFFKKTLFDTLFLELKEDSNRFSVGSYLEPLRSPIKITWSFSDTSFGKELSHAYLSYGKEFQFLGGYWKENKLVFSTKNFGDIVIKKDTIPPSIKYLSKRWNRIKFKIEDGLSGIKKYRATLDGNWIMMEFDAKKSILTSKRENENINLKGSFILTVQDMAGNIKEFKQEY
jgi:murein DD-endopeptidase MepM/ murein hydrolase activator NlpD